MLRIEYLILFKIKAWLDLTKRKNTGETIDNKNIKKHKNDVYRLISILEHNSKVHIPDNIKHDIPDFIKEMKKEPADIKHIGLRNVTNEELIERLCLCFNITEIL